ncbi:MAG: ABC transporter ATP-binding protein [Gemmatimonadales bacterium]
MTAMLEARGLRKVFQEGDVELVEVLEHVDLSVARGQIVSIVGASGAGKSTLLHLLGALDIPTEGEVWLDGTPYSTLAPDARDTLRNRDIGFVFQFHHLLRDFNVLENVMMPLAIGGMPQKTARDRAAAMLESVGLSGRLTHRPAQLSGGEQQRCAVARALVTEPKVLLADEPSGNLDHVHSERLHDLLFDIVRKLETTLVVVTHNRELAESADRILRLQDGRLSETESSEVLL